jgi:hypothetical protein
MPDKKSSWTATFLLRFLRKNQMSQALTCPECGVPLPVDAPDGVCPACVLKGAMEQGSTTLTCPDGSVESREFQLPRNFGDYELIEEIAHGGMELSIVRARRVWTGSSRSSSCLSVRSPARSS